MKTKTNKLRKLLKIGLALLLTVFIFYSCSEDDELTTPQVQQGPILQVRTKIENTEVLNLLKDKKEKINRGFNKYLAKTKGSKSNDSITLEDIEINTEKFSVIESENGKESYTFQVDFPNGTLNDGIINVHIYYDENNELKTSLIGYNLTEEELKEAEESGSFDKYWDKIYTSELKDADFLNESSENNKSLKCPFQGGCSGGSSFSFRPIWRGLTGFFSSIGGFFSSAGSSVGNFFSSSGSNSSSSSNTNYSNYGNGNTYRGLGGHYTGMPSVVTGSLLREPSVASSLRGAGVFLGIDYSNLTTVPYPGSVNYRYTAPVKYYSIKDLKIPNSNSSYTYTNFSNYYGYYYYYGINNIIKDYYNKVFIPQTNTHITSTQTSYADHNSKQSFVNAFFRNFLFPLKSQNFEAHEYLRKNSQLLKSFFDYLPKNNNSEEAKEFFKSANEALINGGEVDFDNRLIYNPLVAQEYRARMSEAERTIFDTLNSVTKALYLKAATQAYIYAETHFPRPVRNRLGDAFKHTFWNALSTVYIGEALTKQLTTAHENIEYNPNYSNHFKETQMDLFNNSRGRQIAYGSGRLYQLVQQALDNGELRYLNNLIFQDGFWNATNDSQLTPTNQ